MRHPKNMARPAMRCSSARPGASCGAFTACRPSTSFWLYIAWISWSTTAGWMPKSSVCSPRWARVCRSAKPWKRPWKTARFRSRNSAAEWKPGLPDGRKWVGCADTPDQTLQPADRRSLQSAISVSAAGAPLLGIPNDANRLGQTAQPGKSHRILYQSRHTAARPERAFHCRPGVLGWHLDHAGTGFAAGRASAHLRHGGSVLYRGSGSAVLDLFGPGQILRGGALHIPGCVPDRPDLRPRPLLARCAAPQAIVTTSLSRPA